MNIGGDKIRSFRLHAHHLDRKIPISGMLDAAGACGLQNSPPGAWETALFNRLEGCRLKELHTALYEQKSLLQAWSLRGAPVVFPTAQSDVFLTPLMAEEGEQPWIYTAGITGALDFLQLPFDELLVRTREAAEYLDSHIIKSKELLDQKLANLIQDSLPQDKRALWRAPSMYGKPGRQTVGGAAVSFLLRPCSFSSMVVFGRREGASPTFTSFQNWTGHKPEVFPDAERELVRKYLHCYGPATADAFKNWLGCTARQAQRLWSALEEETEPVSVGGKIRYMLSADMECLSAAESCGDRMLLLGAHDPYLDMRDRTIILENQSFHKDVWKYVANPGVILKCGRIIGTWRAKTLKDKLDLSMTVWESAGVSEQKKLKNLAEEYAAFRQICLRSCRVD